jgi:hypothetical protein
MSRHCQTTCWISRRPWFCRMGCRWNPSRPRNYRIETSRSPGWMLLWHWTPKFWRYRFLFRYEIPPPISAYSSPHFLLPGIINQVIILRPAQLKPPSPFKPSAAASKPFRAPILSAEQIHAQEQRAVGYFTTPISSPGPSNVFQSA